jgi:hypothetical protein
LYVKELAGVLYFGKSVKSDITAYPGSGKVWRDRIKKYGVDKVKTIWVSDWFTDPDDLQDFAILFSELHDIVISDKWDNLRSENGLSGGISSIDCAAKLNSKEAKFKMANSQRGVSCPQRGRKGKPSKLRNIPKSEITKAKMRKPKPDSTKIAIANKLRGELIAVKFNIQNTLTGEVLTMSRPQFSRYVGVKYTITTTKYKEWIFTKSSFA